MARFVERFYILKVGYQKVYLSDPETALSILRSGVVVKEEKIGDKVVFVPTTGGRLEIEAFDDAELRPMTKEETENKELSDMRWHKKRAEDERDRLRKEVEELKCQVKVLTKGDTDGDTREG